MLRCAVVPRRRRRASRLRANVLEVLADEGYIRGFTQVDQKDGQSEIEIELKYTSGQPAIREIKRVSKPGRRVYSAAKGHPDRRQRPGRCHPLDAEGRDVGLACA